VKSGAADRAQPLLDLARPSFGVRSRGRRALAVACLVLTNLAFAALLARRWDPRGCALLAALLAPFVLPVAIPIVLGLASPARRTTRLVVRSTDVRRSMELGGAPLQGARLVDLGARTFLIASGRRASEVVLLSSDDARVLRGCAVELDGAAPVGFSVRERPRPPSAFCNASSFTLLAIIAAIALEPGFGWLFVLWWPIALAITWASFASRAKEALLTIDREWVRFGSRRVPLDDPTLRVDVLEEDGAPPALVLRGAAGELRVWAKHDFGPVGGAALLQRTLEDAIDLRRSIRTSAFR
jgi:hypothetical protein